MLFPEDISKESKADLVYLHREMHEALDPQDTDSLQSLTDAHEAVVKEMVSRDIPHTSEDYLDTQETILKRGSKWVILSKDGKQLGEFPSRKQALKRLRQIEFFKHRDS